MRMGHIHGCSISDEWTYKGMRVIWMENELLRIGILPDRGADIFEFRYKPADMNLLLSMPDRLRNINTDFSQMRDTQNQFEDHYYGGWQEVLPNSKPFNYRGASLGQHGEVSLIPWEYDILERDMDNVSVRLMASPLRMPLRIEKTITLEAGSNEIKISETLINTGSTALDIMWGHHIALGLPFIEDELKITTNADSIISEPQMPVNRRFTPGIETKWPFAISVDGIEIDASTFPERGNESFSELSYLGGYPEIGFYSVSNHKIGLAFEVNWDASVFKNLWMWQERNAVQDFPWWGNCYTLALEPWTAPWSNDPNGAIERGEWLKILPGASIATSVSAGVKQIEVS